ncbi:response regulator transcription factor [Hydrotalea sp.]|uniref:response regulator transcription factor n=1 Tax=Hydrotalea sp. TaxID=2881279 RepID=UPI00258FC5FA|nr:response regulator transcription factor [Hydrotalea sp.]
MQTIVIADDHPALREGIKNIFEITGKYKVLAEFDNGKALINFIHGSEQYPDFVLLDVRMPVLDGYKTSELLLQQYPSIKVVIFSMYVELEKINDLLKLGIYGFIQKNVDPEEILESIEKIQHNQKTICINMGGEENKVVVPLDNFSEREKELLRYYATELTYKEIADKMGISPKTIDRYREELFKKLNVHSRVGLAIYALQMGIFML